MKLCLDASQTFHNLDLFPLGMYLCQCYIYAFMSLLGGQVVTALWGKRLEWKKIGVKGLQDTGAVVIVMPIKTWERMGFTQEDLIPKNLRLAAANCGAINVAGRSLITVLHMEAMDEFPHCGEPEPFESVRFGTRFCQEL